MDIAGEPENIEYYHALQAALEDCGITESLAPTWYPAGLEVSAPDILSDNFSDTVYIYFSDNNDRFLIIDVTCYRSAVYLNSLEFEKDSGLVEQYSNGTKMFYIFTNTDTITATWSDGMTILSISGNLSIDEIKDVIDSIGG